LGLLFTTLTMLLLLFFARPARAADVADGTITMKIDSGTTKLCVVVPDDQLDPSCDAMIAARISMMTEALAKQQHARVTFVGSLVGPDWVATVTLMRTSDHGEMSQSAIKAMAGQFGPEEKAAATESRVNGLQVVRVENHLQDDGGPEGYVLTHVLAGKTNYILTVAGPGEHQKELEAIAQGAVASVKLEPAEKTEVTTKESDSGFGGMAVKIGIGVLVAVLLVLGARILLTKDEEPPPPVKGKGAKKRRHMRGGKKKREEEAEEEEDDDDE
jgi:hypothetical protein